VVSGRVASLKLPRGLNTTRPVLTTQTDKRDYLINIEKQAQTQWADAKAFETNPAPLPEGVESYADFFAKGLSMDKVQEENPKWFGTFPYAYMNGSLHLGHAFTISKIEFAAGFERMRGKRVLFPVGYHATGMPIKAASDKLIREMEMFGEDFSGHVEEAEEPKEAAAPKAGSSDPSKAKKGKLNAKSTGLQYQYQIMELVGVPRDEIKQFAEPLHWLEFFPPIAKEDLTGLGARVDWRRQFLTTPANPYYDSFVRWQMNKLHQQGRIKFGERYTIYSPKDGQPCMDHDRQSGEAVNPQEYTAVKMKVLEWGPDVSEEVKKASEGKTVYLVAATLRPETMYGQTNCFVGTGLEYGLYEASDNELYFVTERSARNMAFQGCFDRERGVFNKVASAKGAEVIGTKVNPPFGIVPEVYVLPMEGVLATKGTGVVTSVPSDSPDDYRTLMDLRKKPEMYKIKSEWAAVDPIPVLRTPKYGNMAAEFLCNELKIQSQRDTKQLAEAKELTYKEGFYNGVMEIGDFKGESVQDAKPKVREQLIKAGLGFPYAEPESEVISRSADVCVVALVDQWYLDYGEEEWRGIAENLLSRLNTFVPETRNNFEAVLAWLNQWACARSFGLGSRLPWDQQFLVESLSDSTIYMSYYTVAHLLHEDMWGKTGKLGITPEDMTDAMWEHILIDGAYPEGSKVSKELAAELKYSFQYFYPLDIRSSGKDLIPNHLTFWIYIHAAIFPDKHWPRSVRCNGHLMLNGKKMSKSTGNFLTMREATQKFGADAVRLTLADAGDDITDANFEETVANAAILRLHTACLWAEEIKVSAPNMRVGEYNEFDRLFQNEMNRLVEAAYATFDRMEFKEALKLGLYDFEAARNWYRSATAPESDGPGMHKDLTFEWIRNNALLLAPFTPHFSEFICREILGETGSVQSTPFPKPSAPVDPVATQELDYIKAVVDNLRSAEAQLAKRKGGKGKAPVSFDASKPKAARIFVSTEFPEWQNQCVEIVQSAWDEKTGLDEAKMRIALNDAGLGKDKKAMPFVQAFKKKLLTTGARAFGRTLPFNELDAIKLMIPHIKSQLKYEQVDVVSIEEAKVHIAANGESAGWATDKVEAAEPGNPAVVFYNL
jgi:leucyl-tRNA synthetase